MLYSRRSKSWIVQRLPVADYLSVTLWSSNSDCRTEWYLMFLSFSVVGDSPIFERIANQSDSVGG